LYNPLPPGKSAQSGVGRAMPKWQPLQALKPIELQNAGFVQQKYMATKANTFALWTVEEQQAANKLADDALSDESVVSDAMVKEDGRSTEESPTAAPALSSLDAEAIEKIKQEAYERGLIDGQEIQRASAQAQTEKDEAESLSALADQANQILIKIEQGIVSLQENPASWNEPLKRLALHLAEQLVLTELSISSAGIQNMIDRCIETLDVQTASSVVVELNPNDLALLQNHKAVPGEITPNCRMVADAHLLPGSVRVRADDAVVSDLIEHRLETLAHALLENPKAWQAQTAFQPERLSARRGKAETVEDALPREVSAQPLNLSSLDLPDLDLTSVKPDQNDAAEDVSHD